MKVQVQLNGPATPLLEIDEEQYTRIKQALFPKNGEQSLFFTLTGKCVDPSTQLKGTMLTYHINITTVTYIAVIGGEFDVPAPDRKIIMLQ